MKYKKWSDLKGSKRWLQTDKGGNSRFAVMLLHVSYLGPLGSRQKQQHHGLQRISSFDA